MAPAQGWHAQIEKCKWFFASIRFGTTQVLFFFASASFVTIPNTRQWPLRKDATNGHARIFFLEAGLRIFDIGQI